VIFDIRPQNCVTRPQNLNKAIIRKFAGVHTGPEWSFLVKMKIEISKFSGQFIFKIERSDMF